MKKHHRQYRDDSSPDGSKDKRVRWRTPKWILSLSLLCILCTVRRVSNDMKDVMSGYITGLGAFFDNHGDTLPRDLTYGENGFSQESHSALQNDATDGHVSSFEQVKKSNEKPMLVFHIGPPKTATTTIQCELHEHSGRLAKEGDTYFLGKPCATGPFLMDNGEKTIKLHFLTKELQNGNGGGIGAIVAKRLQYHRERNNSVIISTERASHWGLSSRKDHEGWRLLKNITEGFHVRIVVAYRPYFEWLPSLFFQQHKKSSPHASLLDYIRNDLPARAAHPTMMVRDEFLKQFDDVQVFDIHREGDLFSNFACQTLPIGDELCRSLIEEAAMKNGNAPVKNAAVSLDFHRFAFYAINAGYKTNREHSEKFASYQEMYLDEYRSFFTCFTHDEEQRLYNQSVAFEKALVSSSLPDSDDTQYLRPLLNSNQKLHLDSFAKFSKKGKLCELNATRALMNAQFMDFIFGNETLPLLPN